VNFERFVTSGHISGQDEWWKKSRLTDRLVSDRKGKTGLKYLLWVTGLKLFGNVTGKIYRVVASSK
jgi:hypothetical protein